MPDELVSLREYARRRGVSAMAVSKAAKAGRITLEGGKVNVTTADRDWPANTNPGQLALNRPPIGPSTEANGGAADPGEGLEVGEIAETDPEKKAAIEALGSRTQYGAARATREMYLSRLAEIDYKKQTGELIAAEAVRIAAFNAARTARDSLLSMPDRLAPVLAGEADQFEVHRIMSEEIRRVCNDIANAKPV